MTNVVLDASALLAMLKEEPGGAEVAAIIGTAQMNAVNYAKVVGHFIHVVIR